MYSRILKLTLGRAALSANVQSTLPNCTTSIGGTSICAVARTKQLRAPTVYQPEGSYNIFAAYANVLEYTHVHYI